MIADRRLDRRRDAVLFDTLVAGCAPFGVRTELAEDTGFLNDLAVACSPLVGLLPSAMISEQAALQRIGHETMYPSAMRRIVLADDMPIGRLVIDWQHDDSRCVDIAVLPAARDRGIGTALLRAWLTIARQVGVSATLSVRRDSPAVSLYGRLGFIVCDDEGTTPLLTMSTRR